MFVALLGAMIPGPNGLLIAGNTIGYGKRAGFNTLLGTLVAFYVHGLCSYIGLSALILSSSQLFSLFKWIGVLYLLYVGLSLIIQASSREQVNISGFTGHGGAPSVFGLFWLGFVTNVLNPKVSLFYLAIFPQFIGKFGELLQTTLLLVTVQVVVVGAWFSLVVLFASNVRSARRIGILKGTVGTVMLWFGYSLSRQQVNT